MNAISVHLVDKSYRICGTHALVKEANRYLSVLQTRGLSPQTIQAYGFDLVYLFRWLEEAGKIFSDLTQLDLVDYMQYQKNRNAKPRSINRRLVTCESFYRYCYDKAIASTPGVSYPAPYYKGPGRDKRIGAFNLCKPFRLRLTVKVPKTLIETLTAVEVNAFLGEVTRYRDISIVLMMLLCGLRSCEVLSLRKSSIDLVNAQLKILGKGSKERVVPFPKALIDVSLKYLRFERPEDCGHEMFFTVLQGKKRGQPMTRAGLRSLFRYRRGQSGIEKARPHRFRHTFGTEMARAGVSYKALQQMMGHAQGSPVTTQYINLSMADVFDDYQRAMERIQKTYDL